MNIATTVLLFMMTDGLMGDHYGENIYYFLKTRDQSEIMMNNITSIKVIPSVPTIFLIHGWTKVAYTTIWTDMRDEYLKKYECNVVRVDWTTFSAKPYLIATQLIKHIGKSIAKFIIKLRNKHKISFNDIHLVGHSLGAHLSGFIGKNIFKLSGETLGRITGLDPAGPLFNLSGPDDRLTKTDAKAVVVLHTDGKLLGMMKPIGTLDIYANSGYFQPGCTSLHLIKHDFCNHEKSYKYFTKAINEPKYMLTRCRYWLYFVTGMCKRNKKILYQADIDPTATGIYYFKT